VVFEHIEMVYFHVLQLSDKNSVSGYEGPYVIHVEGLYEDVSNQPFTLERKMDSVTRRDEAGRQEGQLDPLVDNVEEGQPTTDKERLDSVDGAVDGANANEEVGTPNRTRDSTGSFVEVDIEGSGGGGGVVENNNRQKENPKDWKNKKEEVVIKPDGSYEIDDRNNETIEVLDAGKDDVDAASTYSLFMAKKDFRYYFQHPYCRLAIAYLVVFCNFLIYAEDPVAHSRKECLIPMIGNDVAFVLTRYPPNAWSLLKVFFWLVGLVVGLFLGKLFVHGFLFSKYTLNMFFLNIS